MITITALTKKLGGTVVLNGIDLDVATGETLALIGPSGTGKSVLLKHIVGLLEPDSGDVRINEHSIAHATYRELATLRQDIGYVFQDAALLDSLTVDENLRLALSDAECRRDARYAPGRVLEALTNVNLDTSVLRKFPRELSGGMRKRVGVARAIINRPRIILYDEPATGLDPRNVERINELVLKNQERFGATSIVITHDIPSVQRVADRVALLAQGAVQFHGTPAQLRDCSNPIVRDFLSIRSEAA
jgi:phospholipid/cholesterol/gamma-HCH transport system ATP-binding protein